LFSFSMTSFRYVWGFVWQGQELDVGRNLSVVYWSFSIIFVLFIIVTSCINPHDVLCTSTTRYPLSSVSNNRNK
jgi:hypothetical protein